MALLQETRFRARVVLLGASNLTRAISTVVESARLVLGSPLELFIALGHGRSFGTRSTVFFLRSLPSILECNLWESLDRSIARDPHLRTFGLITDIGNDIMYGRTPQAVAAWIEQVTERLQARDARVAMTLLPMESVLATTPWQYAIVKGMLFPTRKLKYGDAMARARQLQDRLIDLAARRNVNAIEMPRHWYGLDPIHVKRRHWPEAWSQILRTWTSSESGAWPSQSSWLQRMRLRSARPEEWCIGRWNLGSRQPAALLPDNTTIWMY